MAAAKCYWNVFSGQQVCQEESLDWRRPFRRTLVLPVFQDRQFQTTKNAKIAEAMVSGNTVKTTEVSRLFWRHDADRFWTKTSQKRDRFWTLQHAHTHTYIHTYIYIHTGCWLGLGTKPGCLLGLGTICSTNWRFRAKTPIFDVFSMSLVCVVGTFVLSLCYNSAHIPGFWAHCFQTLFIKMFKGGVGSNWLDKQAFAPNFQF